MTDRIGDRALLVLPVFPEDIPAETRSRLEETAGLAEALELDLVSAFEAPLRKPSAATLLGRGKVDEIGEMAEDENVGLVIVDAHLSPGQQRTLERAWKAKVIDRTCLILEIFGLRARTREGSLQVELARLAYERSRLVRTWTHLERQRGGQGFIAGPGETQIETDRRLLSERITKLRKELEEVRRTRGLHRDSRRRSAYPVVSLVGYTNAGKSTLFNYLTGESVLAKDMPFATLDTTLRVVDLPHGRRIILSDTVGFITDLPPDLVAAFRATLEEIKEADLLINVRDISSPHTDEQAEDVMKVLETLEAGAESGQAIMEAWNKADLLDEEDQRFIKARAAGAEIPSVPISAEKRENIDALLELIEEMLARQAHEIEIVAGPHDSAARAWLFQHGEVLDEGVTGEGGITRLTARLDPAAAGQFRQKFPDIEITRLN